MDARKKEIQMLKSWILRFLPCFYWKAQAKCAFRNVFPESKNLDRVWAGFDKGI